MHLEACSWLVVSTPLKNITLYSALLTSNWAAKRPNRPTSLPALPGRCRRDQLYISCSCCLPMQLSKNRCVTCSQFFRGHPQSVTHNPMGYGNGLRSSQFLGDLDMMTTQVMLPHQQKSFDSVPPRQTAQLWNILFLVVPTFAVDPWPKIVGSLEKIPKQLQSTDHLQRCTPFQVGRANLMPPAMNHARIDFAIPTHHVVLKLPARRCHRHWCQWLRTCSWCWLWNFALLLLRQMSLPPWLQQDQQNGLMKLSMLRQCRS